MRIRVAAMLIAFAYAIVVMTIVGATAPIDFARLFLSYLATALVLAGGLLALRLAHNTWRRGLPSALAAARHGSEHALPVVLPLITFATTMAAFTLCKQAILPGAGFWIGPLIAERERTVIGMNAWEVTTVCFPRPCGRRGSTWPITPGSRR